MARGINKVILVGNIGQDPIARVTSKGEAVTNFSLATSEKWRDQYGQQQEQTEWHRIVIFGKTAEIVQLYVRKGSKLYIEGKLQTRKWQDSSGQDHYSSEIVISNFDGQMVILDKPNNHSVLHSGQNQYSNSPGGQSLQQPEPTSDNDHVDNSIP